MDWIYTTCDTACPALNANMRMLQSGLGGRVGKEVQLIFIAFDPEWDTPEAMKVYAQ